MRWCWQDDQYDQPIHLDYCSFSSDKDSNASEAAARTNFNTLWEKITTYERSRAVNARIEEDGVDLLIGENTSIFDEHIDNGIIYAFAKGEEAELLKVIFSAPWIELSRTTLE